MNLALKYYPAVTGLVKRAEKPVMYVEPARSTPAGMAGWVPGKGYQDSSSTRDLLNKNPAFAQETGFQTARSGWLPTLAAGSGAIALGAPQAGKMISRAARSIPVIGKYTQVLPLAAQAIRGSGASPTRRALGSYVAGNNLAGKLAGPGVTTRATMGVALGAGAADSLADTLKNTNPNTMTEVDRGSAAQREISQYVNSKYDVRTNPLQQLLQSLNNNPEARNALAGLGVGGLGGAALGGLAGHPWLGALLGALLGGGLGGLNPQFGARTWQNLYQRGWNQSGKLNNRMT
jgi:hypothetical protein